MTRSFLLAAAASLALLGVSVADTGSHRRSFGQSAAIGTGHPRGFWTTDSHLHAAVDL